MDDAVAAARQAFLNVKTGATVEAEWMSGDYWPEYRRRMDEAWEAVEQAIREPLESRIEALEEAVRPLLEGPAVCNCDEAYTARGRHEPNAVHADYEYEFAALRALVPPREGGTK